MTPVEWLELVNTGGIIGVLLLNLYMFFSGKVIPKATVDLMLKHAEDRTLKLAGEIKEGIREAVQGGIMAGVVEVRRIRDDKE